MEVARFFPVISVERFALIIKVFPEKREKRRLLIPFNRRSGSDLYRRVILGFMVVENYLVCSVDSAGSPGCAKHETVRATSVFTGFDKALGCKLQKIILETAKT